MSAQEIVWFTLAVLLVIGELMTGTFYLLMVAFGLLAGGLAALVGLEFPAQAIVAAIVTVVGIVGLRRTRVTREDAARNRNVNLDIGEALRVDAWSPERRARVQYRGAAWDVELAPNALATGGEFRIVEVRGNVLVVAPK
jgi:membrane protein implicated in regulation of membrane protease activity